MKNKILTMLTLQNNMNSKVNADWVKQGFPWYRAIWVECAELLDHYGWKWWKKQTPDIDQVKLELVDIWHFGLSILLLENSSRDSIADHVEKSLSLAEPAGNFPQDLELFTQHTLETHQFDVASFATLMAGVDLSFDELYVRYVGKNVLNFFRQDHGYQEGTYKKEWDGKEDNEHLVEVIASLDSGAEDFKEQLYYALEKRYQSQSSLK